MALGIWTPVEGSTKQASMIVGSTFESNKFTFTGLAAGGNHLMIQTTGCLPVYIIYGNPSTADNAVKGVPLVGDTKFVLPYAASITVYSPHETQLVSVSVGTLT